jgi:hypothetical protein
LPFALLAAQSGARCELRFQNGKVRRHRLHVNAKAKEHVRCEGFFARGAIVEINMKTRLAFSILPMLAMPAMADDMKMSAGQGPADKAFMASMQTMMKNMKVKPSGDADTRPRESAN